MVCSLKVMITPPNRIFNFRFVHGMSTEIIRLITLRAHIKDCKFVRQNGGNQNNPWAMGAGPGAGREGGLQGQQDWDPTDPPGNLGGPNRPAPPDWRPMPMS